ncbi:Hypothetical nudix hydrolase YeaB [invertebrate metagenome]|uniref:Hypothetical nudix hydrolase YeaB n=1 Tax=invertebrate metagenome TaxID=1711999 RepID=A0A484H643_9ZZZZ
MTRADLFARLIVTTRRPKRYRTLSGVLSAVLVPLIEHADDITVLLTKRTEHLAHHRGQVCFPGGRAEDADHGPVDTALREAFEEVGVSPDSVTLIGCLEDYKTLTGFVVTPVVGLIRPPLILRTALEEVAVAFEMPLTFLLNPTNHRCLTPVHSQFVRTTYAIPYQSYYIWGATAAILMALYQIVAASGPCAPTGYYGISSTAGEA